VPTITVEVGGKTFADIEAAFAQLGTELDRAFEQAVVSVPPLLLASLRKVAQQLQAIHGNPWNGGVVNSGSSLQRRSGEGLKSILESIRVMNSGDIVTGHISAGSLSFHETGGTIKATRSQYLTIPLPAAMDSRGVPLRERARQWDHTFVKRSKSGNLIIFRSLPGARQLTPLYLLKTSVKIKPRLRMAETLMGEMGYFETRLFERISDYIDSKL
jgi:hypothetical protein